jgi:predicted RNase H-like nuclease (RuvC/YqgF family)
MSMPPADNTAALAEATRRRSQRARSDAEKAISAAQRSGSRTSFAAIAKTANVSRSWLYTQQDLVVAIRRLQDRQPTNARTGPQPASVASIQRRLETALSRIKRLRAENSDLTRRLETAYGEIRRLRGTCHSPEGQDPGSY